MIFNKRVLGLPLWSLLAIAGGLYVLWRVLASRTMEPSSDSTHTGYTGLKRLVKL
jgi:hypothetical protein